MVVANAHCALKTMRSPMASIAALAKVLPRARVASRSCGRSRSLETIFSARGLFSARCANCHLLNEKSAVSASAKKKLAPAKTKIAATAIPMREIVAEKIGV